MRISHLWAVMLAALTLPILSGCATNKTSPSGPADDATAFDRADTDHNGKVTRDELSDFIVNQVFTSRDLNHDGRMTEEEWTGGDSTRLPEFKKRDANGDGIVTKEEAITYGRAHGIANQIMREADTNHDGVLDRAEFQPYYGNRGGPPG